MEFNNKMTALADEIRELSGTTTEKGIDDMTADVNTANEEIANQVDLLAQAISAIEGKAGGGVTLPTLSNPAVAADIVSGKEAINASGTKITGTIPTQAAKTITPSTSSQTAVASGRYTTGAVTVAAIPSQYEDVASETTNYTNTLAQIGTAITQLENELQGKAAGGGSSGGSDSLRDGMWNLTITLTGTPSEDMILAYPCAYQVSSEGTVYFDMVSMPLLELVDYGNVIEDTVPKGALIAIFTSSDNVYNIGLDWLNNTGNDEITGVFPVTPDYSYIGRFYRIVEDNAVIALECY